MEEKKMLEKLENVLNFEKHHLKNTFGDGREYEYVLQTGVVEGVRKCVEIIMGM